MHVSLRRSTIAAVAVSLAIAGTAVLAPIASASTTAPYIQEGSRGQAVVCLQWALAFAVDPGLQKDGIDGPLTTRDVKQFQKNIGVSQDGIVGPKTGDDVYYDDAELGVTPNCFPYIPTDANCPAPACAVHPQAVNGKTHE
jgi:peptidoglycan hydrolase-like protein with peptidoglycan-binding domain